MAKLKKFRYLVCLALLTAMIGGLVGAPAVLAQDEEEKPEPPKIELLNKFPVLTGESGKDFETEVEIKYQGEERKTFDITFSTPQDWEAWAISSYPEKEVAAVQIDPSPNYFTSEKVKVKFIPVRVLPAVGEYVVTMEVSSGDLKETLDIKAKVTAKYELLVLPETGRLNTEIYAGKDNHFTIKLLNAGSAVLKDLTFTSNKQEGWKVDFEPDKIEALESGDVADVNLIINPPKDKTIAGDYPMSVTVKNDKVNEDLTLRITVLVSAMWGWVGVGIVLAVIAGLAIVFRQLGRR